MEHKQVFTMRSSLKFLECNSLFIKNYFDTIDFQRAKLLID